MVWHNCFRLVRAIPYLKAYFYSSIRLFIYLFRVFMLRSSCCLCRAKPAGVRLFLASSGWSDISYLASPNNLPARPHLFIIGCARNEKDRCRETRVGRLRVMKTTSQIRPDQHVGFGVSSRSTHRRRCRQSHGEWTVSLLNEQVVMSLFIWHDCVRQWALHAHISRVTLMKDVANYGAKFAWGLTSSPRSCRPFSLAHGFVQQV